MKSIFIAIVLILFSLWSRAQPNRLFIPFEASNGDNFDFALTGGLTNPQFSEIDLNGDGIQDLIYFDRIGFAVVPFLNNGTANNVDYTFAPEYRYRFPKEEYWMLLRDYNCDQIKDIFAYKYDTNTGKVSITVHKGGRDAQNKIEFTLAKKIIFYHLKGQSVNYNLFNSTSDLPAIDDIDGDGDMDILNFNSSGGYVEMFKNESQELGFGCDSLLYVYNDNCWGRIYESGASEFIDLSTKIDSCPSFPGWNPVKSARHAGSTLLTLDMDNDGDKELILGDLSYTNLNLLMNGGNKDTAHLTTQEMFFPANSFPANISIFPAAFYVDVNNDGAKDLLAAPNILGNSKDKENWYYQNTGTATAPVFTYQKNNFLVDEMIDLGTGAFPTFVDYNGDGLLDIVVGNSQHYIDNNNQEAFLVFYENIGTSSQPVYRQVNNDFANIKQYNQERLVPTTGDLDNDGDMDLLVGEVEGQLLYFENTGTATNPSFSGIVANYAGIDVDKHAHPQLVDADRDGDLDLIIGERNGNTNYFENTGTASMPVFSSTATTETFGFIDAKLPGLAEGNSAPNLIDIGNQFHYFLGNELGELWYYGNVDGNLLGTFTRINSVLDSIDEGEESAIAVANINSDSQLEFLVGNKRGGLSLYTEPLYSSVGKIEKVQDLWHIFPNPVSSSIIIKSKNVISEEITLQICNMLGEVIYEPTLLLDDTTEIDVQSLPQGVYLLMLQSSRRTYAKQFIKK